MSVKNCNQCEKVFASSSSLSHHKRSHNKSDIVTCELCGKQFRTNNLKRHKESCKKVGLDSDKIMFKCDTCGMDFKEETKFNYTVKNLESEAHGKKKLKLVLHVNGYNL